MRFWNYKSYQLYDIYSQLIDSDFSIEKKKLVFKSLFVGEHFSWKIIGISKLCFEEYKKNNFKKVTKFKRVNKKFVRHQFTTFSQRAEKLCTKKVLANDFWEIMNESEKTHLITIGERDSKEYFFIDIPLEGGYFLNQNSGFEYSLKEEYFLKILNENKIDWKKQSLISKDIK
jgi:hypothetical protein|tara:strand:- start:3789 stop:4307 length:519 start_codon:yes stop_codon:yes gene_type:complete